MSVFSAQSTITNRKVLILPVCPLNSNGDVVKITAEDGKIMVKDNHEKDITKGEQVLDIAEQEGDDTDPHQSIGPDGRKIKRSFPILEAEVDSNEWSVSVDNLSLIHI